MLLREFEEVCSMMHFPNIAFDVVHMKLIPFALKILLKDGCMAWLLTLFLLEMALLSCS